jgi:hypothetical protein
MAQAVRTARHDSGLPPAVFWARIQTALRPILTAEAETLRAFGLPLDRSAYTLALELAKRSEPENR